MLFRQFYDHQSSTYSYLLAPEKGNEAILIDPVLENVALYLQWIEELGLKLKLTVETHTHADHITGAGLLQKKLNSQIAMSRQSRANHVNLHFDDGELILVEGLALKALYTPGHTDDSYCFLLDTLLFTGDTLLIRATGRTDFQSGSSHQQYHSLFSKILTLPGTTIVYPAHNYVGVMQSSIAEEIAHNPRLQVEDVEQYAKIMDNLNLPKPKRIDEAVPANLECGFNHLPPGAKA